MSSHAVRIAAVALALTGAAWVGTAGALAVPKGLAGYRSWRALTTEPQLVPYDLAILCARVTEERLAVARKDHGPHTNRWIRVYANPAALAVVNDTKRTTFPAGAIIAKEKLVNPSDPDAEGIAFMIKHPKGQFAESDGWEFAYYPAGGAKATYERCVACHKAGAPRDYVFGSYGQPSPAR
jgi:cytochrome P460